jgi:hypothetical protein
MERSMKPPLEAQRPAPRANAEDRTNLKVERSEIRPLPVAKEAGVGARHVRARKLKEAHCQPGPIDFAELNRAALAAFPAVLARILPDGKCVGAELVALNPRRSDRHLGSFKINRYNGRWADFATGDQGGDPVSLVAYLANVSQVEAARLLARMLGLERRRALR